MTATIHSRAMSMAAKGHRETIAPISPHAPVTVAGLARRVRRMEAELSRMNGGVK